MELRKIANHPLLVRHHYNDEKLRAMAVDILKVLIYKLGSLAIQFIIAPLIKIKFICVNVVNVVHGNTVMIWYVLITFFVSSFGF